MLSLKGMARVPGKDQIEVRVVIPLDVRETLELPAELAEGRRGKGEFKRVFPQTEAGVLQGAAVRQAVKDAIKAARGGQGGRLRPIRSARDGNLALSDWADGVHEADDKWWARVGAGISPAALSQPDAWVTHPALERILSEAMRAAGRYVPPDHDLTPYRESAALLLSGVYARQWGDHAQRIPAAIEPPLKGESITGVLERALKAQPHPEARQYRYYVKRLTEVIGDIPAAAVTKVQMTDFRISLQQMPILKSGKLKDDLTFPQLIEHFEDNEDVPRIAGKTIRTKWFAAYKFLFDFAEMHDIVVKSPVIMPKKKYDGSSGRRVFTNEEIATFFSHEDYPCAGAAHWIPILGLWTGMRLGEIGGIQLKDVRRDDEGVEIFDLTERKLKTEGSSRSVPVPMKLKGFREYVDSLRALGETWLFPELPQGNVAAYGKVFGRLLDDCGLDDPALCFHSFRHTWKRSARQNFDVPEEISDLITGHVSGGGVGRAYGRGASTRSLSQGMEMLEWPSFPL